METNDINKEFKDWKIESLIGEGSFGKVYLAKRTDLNSDIFSAIKVISIPQSRSQIDEELSQGGTFETVRTYFRGVVEEWQNEIHILESLKSAKNIVGIEDFKVIERQGEIGWDILIRMEYLTPLSQFLAAETLYYRDGLKLGIDIANALTYCGKENIIHRDIKPENIFVVKKYKDFKLGDFGIARQIEKTNAALSKKGTFLFMAPEVYKGEMYGKTVDIYSLGLILYRLFNKNRLPFLPLDSVALHTQREESIRLRISGEPLKAPVNASEELSRIILKACAYNPLDRYQSAEELIKDLKTERDSASDLLDRVLIVPMQKPVEPDNETVSIFDVQIPKLAGMSESMYTSLLTKIGLKSEVFYENNNQVEKGNIISVIPDPETIVKKGNSVTLIVSNGPEKVDILIPNGVGLNKDIFITNLTNLGIKHELKYDFNDQYEKDVVISQSVPTGDKAKPDTVVYLNVSKGKKVVKAPKQKNSKLPRIIGGLLLVCLLVFGGIFAYDYFNKEEIKVPNVTNTTKTDAIKLLSELGLSIKIETEIHDDVTEGTVIKQSVKESTVVNKGSSIIITVATHTGAEEVTTFKMPNVVDMMINDAKLLLQNLGAVVKVIEIEDSKKTDGKITKQSISTDSEVENGAEIELTVVKNPTKSVDTNTNVKVPNGIGISDSAFIKSLSNLGLKYSSTSEFNDNVAAGLIISQSPEAYQQVSKGTVVNFVVSKGPSSWSSWVNALPSGVSESAYYIESKTQYSYSDKQTTTGSSPTMDGWTKFNEYVNYGSWSSWSNTAISVSDTLDVETQQLETKNYKNVYKYSRWKYINSCQSNKVFSTYNQYTGTCYVSGSGEWQYTSSDNTPLAAGPVYDGHQSYGTMYFNEVVESVYVNSTYVTQYRSRTKSMTYEFYKWGGFSTWQDEAVYASDSRQVNTQTLYRYKKK